MGTCRCPFCLIQEVPIQSLCVSCVSVCSSVLQMFIGDGAKMVGDAFALAKEKAPAIIVIDELDAIGTKVSRGMLHVTIDSSK